MRLFSSILSAALIAGAAVSADAAPQSRGVTPGQVTPFLTPKSDARPDNPFGSLFGAGRPAPKFMAVPDLTPAADSDKRRPRIVCGMTLIPVDPAFDAAIRRDATQSPKPAVRSITGSCDR